MKFDFVERIVEWRTILSPAIRIYIYIYEYIITSICFTPKLRMDFNPFNQLVMKFRRLCTESIYLHEHTKWKMRWLSKLSLKSDVILIKQFSSISLSWFFFFFSLFFFVIPPIILMMGLFRVFNLVRAATTTTHKKSVFFLLPEYAIENKTEKVIWWCVALNCVYIYFILFLFFFFVL